MTASHGQPLTLPICCSEDSVSRDEKFQISAKISFRSVKVNEAMSRRKSYAKIRIVARRKIHSLQRRFGSRMQRLKTAFENSIYYDASVNIAYEAESRWMRCRVSPQTCAKAKRKAWHTVSCCQNVIYAIFPLCLSHYWAEISSKVSRGLKNKCIKRRRRLKRPGIHTNLAGHNSAKSLTGRLEISLYRKIPPKPK